MMVHKNQISVRPWKLLLLLLIAILLPVAEVGEAQQMSAADLIAFLNYRSDRPGANIVLLGATGCGHFQEDRTAARSLANLGASSLPAIEAALGSIEESGEQSEFAFNSGWLFDAYAKIMGPTASTRLRAMVSNPKLAFLRLPLDRAIAQSLGVTSYVSGLRIPTRVFLCERVQEPRDALDRLILGWERNDRSWLDAGLGPTAKAALDSLVKRQTWEDFRADLWLGGSGLDIAVAYNLKTPGRWSQPEETLEDKRAYDDLTANSERVEIETVLTNRFGIPCGAHRLAFLRRVNETGYLVDNADMRDLLGSIASCAARSGNR